MHRVLVMFALSISLVTSGFAATPSSKHVVLVVEENHGYDSVINGAEMTNLKKLARDYAIATNYYGNHHPSIGNYFVMTTGQTISTDDHFNGTVSEENIISQIVATKEKTWRVYADSLPTAGYVDGNKGDYVKRHVPVAYFNVVRDDEKQRMNLVPFSQFKKDLESSEGLADFSLVIPNLRHDAHGKPPFHPPSLKDADQWLQDNVITPLLADKVFLPGGDGILIVTFDESETSDKSHGGGRIVTVVAGPEVKPQYPGSMLYQHQSLFVTLEAALGLPRLKIVEKATDLGDLFK